MIGKRSASFLLHPVKNANWRYWTVVLQPPHKKTIEEYFLFAGGGSDIDVTHFEAGCLHIGYCIKIKRKEASMSICFLRNVTAENLLAGTRLLLQKLSKPPNSPYNASWRKCHF
jgi:hypothetical protein